MRVFHNWPMLACVLFSAVAISHAQEVSEKTNQRVSHVVFIDIEKIIEEHVRLQKKLAELAKEQVEFVNKTKSQRQTIKSLEEELAQYRLGTPDYVELEEHIVKVKAELETLIAVREKRSARTIAAAHYDAYQDIVQRVSKFAETNNIGAVINYDSSVVESNDPDSVMKALKRRVVYQRNLDITRLITQGCNQTQSAEKEGGSPLQ